MMHPMVIRDVVTIAAVGSIMATTNWVKSTSQVMATRIPNSKTLKARSPVHWVSIAWIGS
jgi:hypothetical protein